MNDVYLSHTARKGSKRLSVKQLIWNTASWLALGGLYTGRLDDHWMMIERRSMGLHNLGGGFRGATVAHITDLHLSPIVRERYLLNFVDVLNSLNVDFVAVTGDFVTGARTYARRVAKVLGRLRPRVATLACLGNHDYGMWHPRGLGGTRGLADYLSEHLVDAGVQLLNNESRVFRRKGSVLQFVGLEDLWTRYDPEAAFEGIDPHMPTVALVHNPSAAPELAALGAQWVLAGHTHGKGRRDSRFHDLMFPSRHRQFVVGQYSLGQDKCLYVNRGIGHSRRSARNQKPEITLFTLQPSTQTLTPVAGKSA